MGDTESVARWLLRQPPGTQVEVLLPALNAKLIEAGIPVWRNGTSVHTHHPELFARTVIWQRGEGCESTLRPYDVLQSSMYLESPVAKIRAGAAELRVRLDVPRDAIEYPLLRDLADDGATDYVVVALLLPRGRRTFASWATDRAGGFAPSDIDALRELIPALSLHVSLDAERYAIDSLLQVYLGVNAGHRVLAGAFKRGTGELIRAAIWFCDLRGFTELSDRLPVREVVSLLDRYFEAVATPVASEGGEILKFIGDAMLAIFPINTQPGDACRRALIAAEAAIDRLANLKVSSDGRDLPPLRIGVALHVGEVMYGNIGAEARLDFTAIGASVNEVCRVESLCKPLQVPLLVTEAFARDLGSAELISLGAHPLKGVSRPPEVFTLKRFQAAV